MPTKQKLFRKAVAMILGVWLFVPSLFAGYYHTQGNQIVDENSNPAMFHGINWFGFETANYALHGLWSRSMNSYLDQMHALGYNLLRVPYCNQMFDPGVMPNGIDFYSNPDLQGLTPIQVLDKLVERAGARGMKIMLDRHRPDSSAQSELWYTSGISEQRWIEDWKMLAQRYAGNDTVIAADLHNEPHGAATWGTGNTATDWRLAAERCGNAILSVNPNWLIVVEGVENFQNDLYWWGGNLKGASTYPVRLDIANRLVYSPHDYGPGVFQQTWFNDPNFPANMPAVWNNHWAYLHLQGIAPVLAGEFGGKSVDLVSKEGIWQNVLVDYIATNQIYWTYWCWNPNSGDTGGVLNDDWTTINTNKQNMLNRLINAAQPQPSGHAAMNNSVLWGVMDWKLDALPPNTDTSTSSPLYRDGNCRIVCHQYQNSNWLAFKTSTTNKIEISRIYGSGSCINLMLYFVSCTHDTNLNTFSYPLNDQFLADFAQLVDAYKTGAGPLYIQVFPEFEEWYNSKPAAEADQYRAKIRAQFAAMAQIAHTNYSRAYIGLCFEGGDFTGDTSQFTNRWNPILTNSDLVFVNFMSPFTQWNTQARAMVKATQLLGNWGLPIMFPYVNLWDDNNTPVFTVGDNYDADAATFSTDITNWLGAALTAPGETQGTSATNWTTNLRTMKSRGLFAFSLYRAAWCNGPTTPRDPDGVNHPLPSYTALTNVMSANSRSYLYPINEAEFWPASHAPVASAAYDMVMDTNCSSGSLVVLHSSNATGQYFTCRVPVTHDGEYRVLIGIRKQTDGGCFNLFVDGSDSPLGNERNCSTEPGIGNYQEYDQGVANFSDIPGARWVDFKFGVTRAGNGGGYALAIDYIKLIPKTPELIPQPPTGPTANGGGIGEILLSWNPSAGATSYVIRRSLTSGGPYTVSATNVTNSNFRDTGLTKDTIYYYVVSAANSSGEGANSAESSATPGTIVVDNTDATGVTITGAWTSSASTLGYNGADYLHDDNTGSSGGKSIRFSPSFSSAGSNRVYLRWTANFNRASNVPVEVNYAGHTQTFTVDQRANGGVWVLLGTFNFDAGTSGSVVVHNDGANGYVIADAVKFEFAGPTPPSIPQLLNWSTTTEWQFQLTFAGDAGVDWHIWASSNLMQWEDLGSATVTGQGRFRFTDTSPANPQRFYRVGKAQP